MDELFTNIAAFQQRVFHNIQGVPVDFDEFDDLSSSAATRKYAHQLAEASDHLSTTGVHYHAINFIFNKQSWYPSRFGNGTFPVWYAATELQTSFYETLYHWKKTFIDAPQGLINPKKLSSITALRTVFTVICKALLIDFRKKTTEDPRLIHPDTSYYPYTQELGTQIRAQGFPGLLTQSARITTGENVVLFKKEPLSAPKHYDNYLYDYDLVNNAVSVKQASSKTIELEVKNVI